VVAPEEAGAYGGGRGRGVLGDGGSPSPHDWRPSQDPDARTMAAAEDPDGEGIASTAAAPTSAPAAPADVAGVAQAIPSNPEQPNNSGKDSGPALGSRDAKGLAAKQSLTATTSTANASTAERAELGQFYEEDRVAGAAPADVDRSVGIGSSASRRRGSSEGIGLGEAVMEAAGNLAYHCQIPGVSEAAAVVSTLAKLFSDSRDIKSGGDSNLRQCRSIVRMLERASKVAGRVSFA